MTKRILLLAVLLTVLLSLAIAPSAFARNGPPTGSCPQGFELHQLDHMDHDKHHKGIDSSLNPDGYICVKHLDNGLHVHVDNVVP